MSKREKSKSSLSLLNSLNEEEEHLNHQSQPTDESFLEISKNVETNTSQEFDRSLEQHKLRIAIEGAFKPAQLCDDTNIDDNKQRLDNLVHLLTERLNITNQYVKKQPLNKSLNKSMSSAAYSSYLSVTFTSKQQTNQTNQQMLSDELNLDLTNLNLTNDCLKEFTSTRLTTNNSSENMIIEKNMTEIKQMNLSRNKLSIIPFNLVNLFSNLEQIDLSENNFDMLSFSKLSKFANLKEINLSSNLLKSIKLYTDEEEEEMRLTNDDLSTNILFTVERLNLANNKLNSTTCLVVAQFRNLKYLNLSNNDFQLNSQSLELQLPWQKNNSHLKGLLELNFSKNNKVQPQQHHHSNRKTDSRMYNSAAKTLSLPYFDALVSLRVLDLSDNNLRNMPNDIKELRHLEELILDLNHLEFLPIELTELRKLKYLSASSNRISELSQSFCSFARFRDSIQHINLSKNQLHDETFTYKIAIFENLKNLDLSHNLFELVPNPLPPNLEELNMNNNKIKSLMIRPLSQLALNDDDVMEVLDLEDKKFRPKTSQVKELTKQQLGDYDDDVNDLDESQRHHRQHVQSSKKKKSNFDERIYDEPDFDKLDTIEMPHVFYLRNLKRLHLRDNHLGEIPPDFGILNSNLEFLDLGFNLLHEISVSLCRGLAYLKYLDLTSNRIRHLPDKLRELSDLEYLDLSKNKLHTITNELCNDMKNLKELNLSHNCLNHLYIPLNLASQNSSINSSSSASRHTSSSSEQRVNKQAEYAKFSFNLPSLLKLNLSNNHLNASLSLYRAFALSSQLTDIDLSSNRLTSLEVDNLEEKESIALAFNQECIFDEEKIKRLSVPKYRLHELTTLNLSNNLIEFTERGGFAKFLCNIYKLAPNMTTFVYDQKMGVKLGTFKPEVTVQLAQQSQPQVKLSQTESLLSVPNQPIEDENDYLFELNQNDYFILNESEKITDKNSLFELLNSKIRPEFYDLLCSNLKSIDLSNNSLKKLPVLVFKLKHLKEIYFDGNLLKKLPKEMYKNTPLIDEKDEEFENLKRLQKKAELARKKAEDEAAGERDNEEEGERQDDEPLEPVEEKKKKRKKKKKDTPPQIDPVAASIADKQPIKEPEPLLADHLEIFHLNNNLIEHVPNNLFSLFKNLREIKLNDNPLTNPPQHSVCVSAKLTRNQEFLKQQQHQQINDENTTLIKLPKAATTVFTNSNNIITNSSNFMRSNSVSEINRFFNSNLSDNSIKYGVTSHEFIDKRLNLPNLFFETTENLKPLQSYMFNHKKREVIKDNIDSLETLMKLLRRLKMPIDRCEYVCTEIQNSVSKNWSKIAAIEYPPQPGKLSMSRKELQKKMQEYILKLQAWNLLNAWRTMYGADAHTDELLRILKLMNSNNFENDLYEKLYKLKYRANAFRV